MGKDERTIYSYSYCTYFFFPCGFVFLFLSGRTSSSLLCRTWFDCWMAKHDFIYTGGWCYACFMMLTFFLGICLMLMSYEWSTLKLMLRFIGEDEHDNFFFFFFSGHVLWVMEVKGYYIMLHALSAGKNVTPPPPLKLLILTFFFWECLIDGEEWSQSMLCSPHIVGWKKKHDAIDKYRYKGECRWVRIYRWRLFVKYEWTLVSSIYIYR